MTDDRIVIGWKQGESPSDIYETKMVISNEGIDL
jgi:hypothetical protein